MTRPTILALSAAAALTASQLVWAIAPQDPDCADPGPSCENALIRPAGGATGVPLVPVFEWQCVNSSVYSEAWLDHGGAATLACQTTGTSCSPQAPLQPGDTYGLFVLTYTVDAILICTSATHTFTTVAGPEAAFTWSPTTPGPYAQVELTDLSTGSPTSWQWDFGDGSSSTDQNPTHSFAEPGSYQVTLRVANDIGADSVSHTLEVGAPPVASFLWSPASPRVGQRIAFTDTSTGDPSEWSWSFGDGRWSTSHNPSHTYTTSGEHTVGLEVTNEFGSDSVSHVLTVRDAVVVNGGEERQVSPDGVDVGPQPHSAADLRGASVKVWQQAMPEGKAQQDEQGVFARLLDRWGDPVGEPFLVGGVAASVTAAPAVDFDGEGNFVIGWLSDDSGGMQWRSFSPNLDVSTGPIQVNDVGGRADSPSTATNAAGQVLVAWQLSGGKSPQGEQGIFARFFDPDGEARGGSFRVDQDPSAEPPAAPAAAAGSAGFVVVWQQAPAGKQDGAGVFARIFGPSGAPATGVLRVDDGSGTVADPCAAADAAGNIAVAWSASSGDGDGWDVFVRLLAADGEVVGEPIQVNTSSDGDQTQPAIAMNSVGDLAVAWHSAVGADEAIVARFSNASGETLSSEIVVFAGQSAAPRDPSVTIGDDDAITVTYSRAQSSGTGRGLYSRSFAVDNPDAACSQTPLTNCLNRSRFQVRATWRDFAGNTGAGTSARLTDDTGYFWFFDDANVELVVKVLDGTDINSHYWVFYGALSNVEYTITVTDTETGNTVTYFNPSGHFASIGDTQALPDSGFDPPRNVFKLMSGADPSRQPVTTTDLTTASPGSCFPSNFALCLNDNRFKVGVQWRDFEGRPGAGRAVPITGDTGSFWFFNDANVELVVKVLDARGINNAYWVFYGSLSNVEYTITITDTETGIIKTYMNPLGEFGSVGDVNAFPLP